MRRTALVMLCVLALSLAACAPNRGFNIGPWQIIKPPPPVEATDLVVTRVMERRSRAKGEAPEVLRRQRLEIDLVTGQATLTDHDGRIYPLQLPSDLLADIRAGLTDRSIWLVERRAPEDARDVTVYTLRVFEQNDREVAGQSVWTVPGQEALPEVFEDLMTAFGQAHRVAHPLSERVDLLE